MENNQPRPCITVAKNIVSGRVFVSFEPSPASKEDYEKKGMELIDSFPLNSDLAAFGVFILSSKIGRILKELIFNIQSSATAAIWKELKIQQKAHTPTHNTTKPK